MDYVKWRDFAHQAEDSVEWVDWKNEFFVCPDCGKSVYRKDYPVLKIVSDKKDPFRGVACPICGFVYWGV